MNRRGETTEETSGAPVVSSSQTDAAEQRKRTTVIYVVYLIAALDITWMFLQFSVTPVSIWKCQREAEISVPAVNVNTLTEAPIEKRMYSDNTT